MQYGFSYMGFLFLLFLMAPSFYWANLPGYTQYRSHKKWVFAALDRAGLTAMFPVTLIFKNYDYRGPEPQLIFLILGGLCMLFYYLHWIRCCRQHCAPMSLGKIPLTVLPVLSMVFLSIYGHSLWLFLAAAVYGIGHVGGVTQEPQAFSACPCCSEDDSCNL